MMTTAAALMSAPVFFGLQLRPSACRKIGTHAEPKLQSRLRTVQATTVATGKAQAAKKNPIGVHALVWCGGWSEQEAWRAIEGTASLGYDLIEIPVLEPSTVDAKMTKKVLRQSGMQAAASMGLRFDADVSSPDSACAQRGEALLTEALDLVAAIGGTHLVGVLYSALGKYREPPTAAGRANLVSAMRQLANRAANLGVTIGLEVVNRYESNVLNTASQAVELVEEIGKSNILVHLDSHHMNIEERGMAEAVKTCGSRLGYIHVGESHRGYLGTGSVDWQSLFRALAETGYTGPITFESFSSRIVSPALSTNLCVWRDLWDDSEDLAQQAKAFIDSQLAAARRAHDDAVAY
eukprot:jgi/Chlat1/5252/Chrsp33S05013